MVWRLGPQLQVWDLARVQVATIWRAPEALSWHRVEWPHEPFGATPIAPVDLSVGHTLELTGSGAAPHEYACVIAVQAGAVIAYCTPDIVDVERASGQIVARWHETQLHRGREQYLT